MKKSIDITKTKTNNKIKGEQTAVKLESSCIIDVTF